MTLLQLKYVAAVAECGSFSKAAQQLFITQPGISKMVCSLEEELGITIFVRSTSGISLTADGKELLNMGNRLLNDAELISTHFHQEAINTRETLNVSSLHYCFVMDALSMLQNKSQRDSYTYKLHIGQNPEVIQHVAEKESELGILFIDENNKRHMERIFRDNGLEFHCLVVSYPYVFFHQSHPLASREIIALPDLQPYPCIMYELNANSPSILQEELFPPDFYPQKVNIVNSLTQSLQVMTMCQGYDLGNGIIAPSNGGWGVVRRRVAGFDTPVEIGWVCQKGHKPTALAARLIENLQLLCANG